MPKVFQKTVNDCEWVVFATPSQSIRSFIEQKLDNAYGLKFASIYIIESLIDVINPIKARTVNVILFDNFIFYTSQIKYLFFIH